jgi:RNA polymerase sigma-70 factor (ECF subfamily)
VKRESTIARRLLEHEEGILSTKSFIERELPGDLDSSGKELPVHCVDLKCKPLWGREAHQQAHGWERFTGGREAAMVGHDCLPSFEDLVLPHLDAAYNLARWLTRDERDAEDVVQEAYLRAFRFFSGFRGGDARAWLMKIVRNTCYTWLHANRTLQDATEFDENLSPPDSRVPNPEEVVLQNDSSTLVRKALEKLPVNYREVLILRELEGMSYREIAETTGMPAGTVMSTLSRARGRLREVLTGLMNGDTAPSSRRIAAVNT